MSYWDIMWSGQTLNKSVGGYLGSLIEMGGLTHCGYYHSIRYGESLTKDVNKVHNSLQFLSQWCPWNGRLQPSLLSGFVMVFLFPKQKNQTTKDGKIQIYLNRWILEGVKLLRGHRTVYKGSSSYICRGRQLPKATVWEYTGITAQHI